MTPRLAVVSVLAACTLPLHAALVSRGPYLQSAGTNRMTVCWRSDVATTREVAYSLNPSGPFTTVTAPGTDINHAVTITGLQPATRYYYRIKGTPATGAAIDVGGVNHWFTTAPVSGTAQPTRIWVVGDSGYQTNFADFAFSAYMSATAALGENTDVFLMLGDNAYANGTDSAYQGALFNRYASLIRNTPMWSTIGNHDDTTVPAVPPAPYYSIFNFPTAGECGGLASGTEQYYSFDHGNIHFICIDSNTYATVADAPGGAYGMVDWLRDDLMACTADWIIVFMHQAPYSKGSHDSDTELNLFLTRQHIIPMLETHGVDLVLGGHSHSYERSMLIDGHYGVSSTWNAATMLKASGNGSDLGGVNAAGTFITGPSAAGGAYQKPAATARAGAVYAVSGGASSVQFWWGGSTAFTNPNPHPVHAVNLMAIGSMLLQTDGNRLNGQYLGQNGTVMDDFTIVKGATYTLHPPAPINQSGTVGIAFPVTRTGYTAAAETVPVSVEMISGSGVTPAQGTATFAAGQSSALVSFFPAAAGSSARFEAELLPTTRSVQPGGAQRKTYRISGGPQTGQFAATPAAAWYASRFGTTPPNSQVWETDTDGDGLVLLHEYALGGEPGRNDAVSLPRASIENGFFTFRYTRPHGRSDLTYQALASDNLSSWPVPGPADVSDGPATALGEPRKVQLPLDSPAMFLRLKFSLQN
jgi:hypothetical protein